MSGRLSVAQGALLGALACSPATVLALERANTDVIIFCLVAAGLVCLRRGWTTAAWAGLFLAAVLKLFPAFAFGSFLRLGWRRAWPWLAAAGGGMVLLCFIQREEIRGVLRETPQGGTLSYGAVVWVQVANKLLAISGGNSETFTPYLLPTQVCAALLIGLMFRAGVRGAPRMGAPAEAHTSLEGFRAGTGVFLATFLLGSHYTYRLIFLLLCVPWLLRRDGTEPRDLARARSSALGLLIAALWLNPLWSSHLYFVRECAVWGLAAVVAWLVGRTMPPGTWPLRGSPELAKRGSR